jgi:hypothetical protein
MGILLGISELPRGFAEWQSKRDGGFVYYVDLPGRRNRAALSTGSCSVGGSLAATFLQACRTHDLGYNLLRYFASQGRRISTVVRRSVDARLGSDFGIICGSLSWQRRPGCNFAAFVGMLLVGANTRREGAVPQ